MRDIFNNNYVNLCKHKVQMNGKVKKSSPHSSVVKPSISTLTHFSWACLCNPGHGCACCNRLLNRGASISFSCHSRWKSTFTYSLSVQFLHKVSTEEAGKSFLPSFLAERVKGVFSLEVCLLPEIGNLICHSNTFLWQL